MHRRTTTHALRTLAAALLAAAVSGCATLAPLTGGAGAGPDGAAPGDGRSAPPQRVREEGKYVVVDVDHNELRFMDGDRVLWRAPVGTGTGFRLVTDSTEWTFTTPSGMMQVQYKEMNPTWVIPDWWYVENERPIPAPNAPERRLPGGLGAAAVYLGNEIAIHGTDKPELLGQRVSHGCIRLANADAIRLYHNVQVGTPVRIVGRAEVQEEMPDSAAAFTRPRGRTQPWTNPRDRVSTASLLRRLDRELAAESDTASAWVLSASALLERGLRTDSLALRGVLARAGAAATESRRREYDTFVADAFARGSLRAAVSLSKIGREARERAAEAIVRATMALYHGPLDATAPWPTKRVPKWRLGPLGQGGWEALREAEERWRTGGGAHLASREEG